MKLTTLSRSSAGSMSQVSIVTLQNLDCQEFELTCPRFERHFDLSRASNPIAYLQHVDLGNLCVDSRYASGTKRERSSL